MDIFNSIVGMRSTYKKLQTVLCLIVFYTISAQQDPAYTQYTYNMTILNPAYAGTKDGLRINLLSKTQWVGIEDGPKTTTFSIHSPLEKNKNLGVGLSAINDTSGPLTENRISADVSYSIYLRYKGTVSFGVKAGYSFQSLDETRLNFNTTETTSLENTSISYPDFGLGLYYYEDNFYAGISVPSILRFVYLHQKTGEYTELKKTNTLYMTTGYVFKINDNLQLKPSVLTSFSTILPINFDLSNTFFLNNKFELGVSYRNKTTVGFIGAFNLNNGFRVGYAYDYLLSELGGINNGSHEILLLVDLKKMSKKPNSKTRMPQYFF